MGVALFAADAVVGLAELRDTAVIADEEGAACFAIARVLPAGRDVAFVQTFVVVQQDGGDVDAVRAGHAIFAVVARDGVELHHRGGGVLQEPELVVGQRFERGVATQVVLQVLHARHAAENSQNIRVTSGKAEGPRSYTELRLDSRALRVP